MTLDLPRKYWDQIRERVERAYPEQSAGLLIGTRQGSRLRVREVVPAEGRTNSFSKQTFLLPPQEYLQAQKWADAHNLEVLGFFRSRLNQSPRPTLHDLDRAWPNSVYLLIEVRDGRVRGARAYWLKEDRSAFYEVPVTGTSSLS